MIILSYINITRLIIRLGQSCPTTSSTRQVRWEIKPSFDDTSILTTNYAKNYCDRTLIVKVIVENVVTCFFGTRCIYVLSKYQSFCECL